MEQMKSGADVLKEGLEREWLELKTVLLKLPPWFRLSQFLMAVGAEENLKRMMANAKYRRNRNGYKDRGVARPEMVEAFTFLWHEVLDPVDRALLEEHVGLNEEQGALVETVDHA